MHNAVSNDNGLAKMTQLDTVRAQSVSCDYANEAQNSCLHGWYTIYGSVTSFVPSGRVRAYRGSINSGGLDSSGFLRRTEF